MGPNPSFDDVTRKINTLVNELRNLMLSLDTLNVVELNAEVIIAGTVTADKMNVSELSAITANLGHITAGLIEAVSIIGSVITGSLIQTVAQGNYPRAYMSNTGASFVVETAPGTAIFIYPGGGIPALLFQNNGRQTAFELTSNGFFQSISTAATQLSLTSAGAITLNGVEVVTALNNINSALSGKANSFTGFTGVISVTDGGGNPMGLYFENGIFKTTL